MPRRTGVTLRGTGGRPDGAAGGRAQPADGASGAAPTPPLTAKRRATRSRLLAGARAVIAARGVEAASVEEICDEAGFTRGAFYSNFTDKDALLVAVVEAEADRLRGRLTEVRAESPRDVGEAVETFFSLRPFSADFYVVHTDLVLHFVRRGRGDARARTGRTALDRVHAVLADLLHGCLEDLGRRPTVPMTDLVRVLTGVLGQSHRAALEADDPDVDAMARRVMPALLEALTTDDVDRAGSLG